METVELKGDLSNTILPKTPPPELEYEKTEEKPEEKPEEVVRTINKEKRNLIIKINRYRTLFKDELIDLEEDLKNINDKTILQLENLLNEIQFNVESRRSLNSARGLALSTISLMEMSGGLVGLELEGLTTVCSNSKDLMTNIDECALKYDVVYQIDPIIRLSMTIGQIALVVDASNKSKKGKLETTTETENKFNDL